MGDGLVLHRDVCDYAAQLVRRERPHRLGRFDRFREKLLQTPPSPLGSASA